LQLLQMRFSQPPVTADAASDRAASSWAANLGALAGTQPWLAEQIAPVVPEVSWIHARDGSLTGMLAGERWWAGCSLPARAARFMLKTLDIRGSVACFLAPVHAAQVRVALELLDARQAIVAIVPEEHVLSVLLHCDDFSSEIVAHRLWFAAGQVWQEQLRRIFTENPGLSTPAQFIRPILADPEPADRLIGPAQKVFADEAAGRSEKIQALVTARKTRDRAGNVCMIAPSGFRLWESAAAEVLAGLLGSGDATSGPTFAQLDTDDPTSASPLALAGMLAESDALVTANVFRSDAPGVAPADMPWIAWVTSPRIPAPDAANPRDVLILADPSWQGRAEQAGWPSHRLRVAGWADLAPRPHLDNAPGSLGLLADTAPIEPPEQVTDYSSQLLLWEMIQAELTHDPFLVGDDAERYLANRMANRQIAEQGLDRGLFLERLIVPAYQQGLARVLIASGIPLRLFGKGWDRIGEFAPHAYGPVQSRPHFCQVLSESSALVHAWPFRHAHPIDAAARPVLRAAGRRHDAFVREARTLLAGLTPSRPNNPRDPLSQQRLREILQSA